MLLVAVALVAADKGEKKKGDAEAIQGKWIVVEVTVHRLGNNDGGVCFEKWAVTALVK